MQNNHKRISKSFYLYITSAFLLIFLSLYITAVLDRAVAIELSELIMHIWWLGICAVSSVYALFMIYSCRHKIKSKLYQSLYKLFYKTNPPSPCLILDKRLNIAFINKEALLDISLFQNKIKHFVPDFTVRNIQQGNYNFKKLDPKHSQISGLSIFLNAHYSNKYKYNNLSFNFKTKPLKLLGHKIGIFLEFNFENNANFKLNSKSKDSKLEPEGIVKPATTREAKNLEHSSTMTIGDDYFTYEVKNQAKTKFTHEPFDKMNPSWHHYHDTKVSDQQKDSDISESQQIELEDIKLKLVNILLKNKLNKTIEISRSEYLNLYHSVDKLISKNKPTLILQKVD